MVVPVVHDVITTTPLTHHHLLGVATVCKCIVHTEPKIKHLGNPTALHRPTHIPSQEKHRLCILMVPPWIDRWEAAAPVHSTWGFCVPCTGGRQGLVGEQGEHAQSKLTMLYAVEGSQSPHLAKQLSVFGHDGVLQVEFGYGERAYCIWCTACGVQGVLVKSTDKQWCATTSIPKTRTG